MREKQIEQKLVRAVKALGGMAPKFISPDHIEKSMRKGNYIMHERDLEQRLRIEIRARGGLALKFISPSMVGVPDRLILLRGGRVWFVEMKAPGRVPTPKQLKVHKMLRELGFQVLVLDSIQAVDEFLERVGDDSSGRGMRHLHEEGRS